MAESLGEKLLAVKSLKRPSSAKTFMLNLKVIAKLEEIVSNSALLIQRHLVSKNVKFDDGLLEFLVKRLRILVKAITFYTVDSILASRSHFQSIYSFLFMPPKNYDRSQIYYPIIQGIYEVIGEEMPEVSLLRPLVKQAKPHFCNDKIHHSKLGMSRNLVMFKHFLAILVKHTTCKSPNFHSIACQYNETAEELDTVQNFKFGLSNDFQERNYPFKSSKQKRLFERKHYRFMGSSKSLAVSTDKRRLRIKGDSMSSKFDKMFAMHTDSIWRDLCSNDVKIKQLFVHKEGYFKYANVFTISPGSTTFDLNREFRSCSFNNLNFTAVVSVLAFGTNELLQIMNYLDSVLCDMGLLQPGYCSVCNRSKAKPDLFFSKKLHGLPEILLDFNCAFL